MFPSVLRKVRRSYVLTAVLAIAVLVVIASKITSRTTNTTTSGKLPSDISRDGGNLKITKLNTSKSAFESIRTAKDLNVPTYFCNNDVRMFKTKSVPQTRLQPLNWNNETDITSRRYTTFSIVDKKQRYRMCDRVQITIVAKNGRNEPKQYGGDYFRARIMTNDPHGLLASSTSDGDVVDNGDGTYSATFTLKWSGQVDIRVYLIHPSEGTHVLSKLRKSQTARYSYKGTFCSTDGSTSQERECNIFMSSKHKHVCKFTDRRTRISWYCLHPTEPKLNCTNWCKHRSDRQGATAQILATMTDKDKMAFDMNSHSHGILDAKDYTLQVLPAGINVAALPPCKPGFRTNSTYQSGFYSDEVWISPYCNVLRFSTSLFKTTSCLRGKTLYFLGDSTTRQLFEYIIGQLKDSIELQQPHVAFDGNVGPIVAIDRTHNISMMYRFHGLPVGGDKLNNVNDIRYLANTIDGLPVDHNSVIAISVWMHFTAHNASLYVQRMRGILDAVKRLHQRCPETLVIFQSPNTRERTNLESVVYFSDWYARDLDHILRDVLSSYPRTGFLDAWDMTNAHLSPSRVHPTGSHIENLSDHYMSYICPYG